MQRLLEMVFVGECACIAYSPVMYELGMEKSILRVCLVVVLMLPLFGCLSSIKNDKFRSLNHSLAIPAHELKKEISKAKAGNKDSAFRLSKHYGYAEYDFAEEDRWLEVASSLGHPVAKLSLAVKKMRTNPAEAKILLLQSADLGDPHANLKVGKLYLKGEIFEKNESAAKQYFLSATYAGSAEGALYVARMAGVEPHVEPSTLLAMHLFAEMKLPFKSQIGSEARERRVELMRAMSAEEIRLGVSEFYEKFIELPCAVDFIEKCLLLSGLSLLE